MPKNSSQSRKRVDAASAAQAAQLAANGSYVAAKARREAMEAVVAASGVNLYDVRLFGEYNSSATRSFLSLPSTRARLGVLAEEVRAEATE